MPRPDIGTGLLGEGSKHIVVDRMRGDESMRDVGVAGGHGDRPRRQRRSLGLFRGGSLIALTGVLFLLGASAQAGSPARGGVGEGVSPVATIPYDSGTHLAVARIQGRDYAFASSMGPEGVVRVIDVSRPAKPRVVAKIPCHANQAHLQISHDKKTLIIGEDAAHEPDACASEGMGFYTIDISNPRRPKVLGAADIPRGAHTTTAHPTKPIVYVSYGDVVATDAAEFEIWSIKDPARPAFIGTVPVTGYHGPHDITFTADGKRAVAASMSLMQILDTTDPTKPVELGQMQCPGCSHNHEVRFTPDEKQLVVSDETPGGPGCPLGGLYFYAWDPGTAPYMTLQGQWQPEDVGTPRSEPTRATMCTSHTFDISPDGTRVAASWHTAGLQIVDFSNPVGVGVGGQGTGPHASGWYQPGEGDAFSAKFDRSGRYVFVNDFIRGFEVFRLEGES
jgi:hypothetical protein